MTPVALLPRQPVPALNVPLTAGGRFVLGAEPGKVFDLVVFYRGLHCPICAKYLIELERLAPEFAQRGVQVVAISSDDQDRAQQMADKGPDSSGSTAPYSRHREGTFQRRLSSLSTCDLGGPEMLAEAC